MTRQNRVIIAAATLSVLATFVWLHRGDQTRSDQLSSKSTNPLGLTEGHLDPEPEGNASWEASGLEDRDDPSSVLTAASDGATSSEQGNVSLIREPATYDLEYSAANTEANRKIAAGLSLRRSRIVVLQREELRAALGDGIGVKEFARPFDVTLFGDAPCTIASATVMPLSPNDPNQVIEAACARDENASVRILHNHNNGEFTINVHAGSGAFTLVPLEGTDYSFVYELDPRWALEKMRRPR